MKRFGMRLPLLPGPRPCGPILSKATLMASFKELDSTLSARQKAASLLWAARKRRDTFYQQTLTRLAKEADDSRAAWAQQQQEAIEAALSEAIHWCVEESALETATYQRLLQQMTDWMVQRLEAFTLALPWATLLAEALKTAPKTLEGALTLSLCPEDVAAITPQIAQSIQITTDPALSSGEARLHNSEVVLHFNLKAQWDRLVEQLLKAAAA